MNAVSSPKTQVPLDAVVGTDVPRRLCVP